MPAQANDPVVYAPARDRRPCSGPRRGPRSGARIRLDGAVRLTLATRRPLRPRTPFGAARPDRAAEFTAADFCFAPGAIGGSSDASGEPALSQAPAPGCSRRRDGHNHTQSFQRFEAWRLRDALRRGFPSRHERGEDFSLPGVLRLKGDLELSQTWDDALLGSTESDAP